MSVAIRHDRMLRREGHLFTLQNPSTSGTYNPSTSTVEGSTAPTPVSVYGYAYESKKDYLGGSNVARLRRKVRLASVDENGNPYDAPEIDGELTSTVTSEVFQITNVQKVPHRGKIIHYILTAEY